MGASLQVPTDKEGYRKRDIRVTVEEVEEDESGDDQPIQSGAQSTSDSSEGDQRSQAQIGPTEMSEDSSSDCGVTSTQADMKWRDSRGDENIVGTGSVLLYRASNEDSGEVDLFSDAVEYLDIRGTSHDLSDKSSIETQGSESEQSEERPRPPRTPRRTSSVLWTGSSGTTGEKVITHLRSSHLLTLVK